MPILTFPDGNTRAYDAAVTGRTVVEGIAKSLAKRTVAMALDGVVQDLDDTISQDAAIEFISRDDPPAIYYMQRQWTTVLRNDIEGFVFNPINIGTFNFYTMSRAQSG